MGFVLVCAPVLDLYWAYVRRLQLGNFRFGGGGATRVFGMMSTVSQW